MTTMNRHVNTFLLYSQAMNRILNKFLSSSLILGIFLFPSIGILSHSFAHTINLDHGTHVHTQHSQDNESNTHPNADLKDLPDGIAQRGLLKNHVRPAFLNLSHESARLSLPEKAITIKIDRSPPPQLPFFLQPHFSHAPPAIF